ncbi:flagellin [Bacillus cereus]|uniref:flagellin N-terminal helical domain-containing protein n=1 Tax=Bacillus cereus TaxID=1396 RepID=UPI000BEB6A34|nr:flagellin [Bacillus cereus]PDY78489.1 flagellin [Bacillus cereus]PEC92734.1 flagellin [Bacillus cereus]PEE10502.1 flagellin [Bacillus cereus]PES14591.1 flagellin [Bacillus cereus]PET86069.1 flagellin [Bacillus cereus]
MRINTNINSMRTQEYMRQNQAKMSNAMDRLSSGKRINNASDDAAGLAIATRMRARENGLGVAANNTQDGMSLIRTADSALQSVSNILLRMRDLANQSANGTNTDENKAAMEKEFGQLKDQIKYITDNTQFNDKNLLDAASGTTKSIAIQTLDSDQASTQIEIKIAGSSLAALGLDKVQIGQETVAKKDLDVLEKAMGRLATPNTDATTRDLDVQVAKDAFDKVKGFIADPAQAKAVERAFEDYTAAEAGKEEDAAKAIEAAYKKVTGLTAGATGTVDAHNAVNKIDAALKTVADNRATLGATLNRLDFNVNNLKSQSASMASAASQIEDADMAKEMSEMTKFKILNEAGISMLSQANQTPQMVSKLLQ